VLAEHDTVTAGIEHDAAWARATAAHAASTGRSVALAVLTDATGAGGRSRAQAFAQLARAARRATEERVAAFAIGVEDVAGHEPAAALVARLVADPAASALSGAELVAGDGWLGLRSHPRPVGSIALDRPDLPPWFDDVLREVLA
jgi:hypothetical protein